MNTGPKPSRLIFGSLCVDGHCIGKILIETILYADSETGWPVTPSAGQIDNDCSRILNCLVDKFPGTRWVTWVGWGLLELLQERRRRGLEPAGKPRLVPERKIMLDVQAKCVNCGREFVIPELDTTFGLPGIQPRFGCPECIASHQQRREFATV